MPFILGIESSCDESAAAILQYEIDSSDVHIVSEFISSQVALHQSYGGVVPELAAREHLRNLPFVVSEVLDRAKLAVKDLSSIAVSRGPGLKGCLLMGLNFARGLALSATVPLIGVNHIEAHLLSARLDNPDLEYPFLALIVSGGHTEVHYVPEVGKYELIARTIDDAAGEAFDKSANLLGFPYPGGAALAALAGEASSSRFKLPKVMRESEGFSFSGLKTAIALLVRKHEEDLRKGSFS